MELANQTRAKNDKLSFETEPIEETTYSYNDKPRILCVDDEKIVLDSLKSQLRNFFGQECLIEIAESGFEALEIIDEIYEDLGVPPSVIICDQIMPQMKGDQLLKKIKKKYPKTLCILLTGQADITDLIAAINNAGLYKYIAKPWDKDDLNSTVRRALIAHQKDYELEIRNSQLVELNKNLENKVLTRTKEITRKNEQLELKGREISQSLTYAKRIQDALLPTESKIEENFPEHFILFKPSNIVSGDFYWFKKIDNLIFIAVVDCTGHGIPGALMSMISYELLFNTIVSKSIYEPKDILKDMHDSLVIVLKQASSGVQDGMDMAICAIDTTRKNLKFAGAKNPLRYIENEALKIIKGDSLSIGGMADVERNFKQHEIPYNETMPFYLTSDGYMDQFGGEAKKKFSRKSFRKLLEINHQEPMKDQGKILDETLKEWQGEEEQVDDITVIGFRVTNL